MELRLSSVEIIHRPDSPPVDATGEPASGFVASEPVPTSPEYAAKEPFAAILKPLPRGETINPFAHESSKDRREHEERIARLLYARGLGPKPPGLFGKLIRRVFTEAE